jgi:3-methyladenine DNA glycosylase/8-oxoguanine DNA glycosylase
MAKLIKTVGPCKLQVQSMQSCYETLLESIVYQQLTGKAAATILGRVKALYGDGFPSPAEVLATENQTLRDAGLSGAKTAAIKDLSEKASAGLLPGIEEMHVLSDEEIVKILSTVRGIGEWTVQMMLIFRLGRADVMPCNDYGVRKGFARTYELDELPSPKQLLQHAEKWRPYRTIASWYLWRSLEL